MTIKTRFVAGLAVLGVVFLAAQSPAQDDKKAEPAADYVVHPEASVSVHRVTIGGEPITYLAVAGTTPLVTGDYEEAARVFSIAYTRLELVADPEGAALELLGDDAPELNDGDSEFERLSVLGGALREHGHSPAKVFGIPDPGTRPLTFSFNGGPGSSSVWLHMGVFGPRLLTYADTDGNPGPPPYELRDNAWSLLDKSDFVFIDPVSTGYSRASEGTSPKDFHGVQKDIDSVAEFIRRYISTHERWRSQKYIAGESYGTTRAAGLVQTLHDGHGIGVNGVILVSAILQFSTARFDQGNDLPFPLFLPTYAATAWYHGALEDRYQRMDLFEFLDEVEAFASTDYTLALMQGDALSDQQRADIAARIAGYTGLDAGYVDRANLRVSIFRFAKEVLRDRRQTVGRFDSRFKGVDRDAAGERYDYDPSYAAIKSIYTSSFNAYVREELGYATDMPYEILTNVWPWEFGSAGNNRYLNVAERMRGVMHQQPHMRVWVGSGVYDLATPYYATEYTMNHLSLAPELRDNIEIYEYEAGHMMYLHQDSLEKMKRELDQFYDSAP